MVECSECGSEFNILVSDECPTCGAPKKIATKRKKSVRSRISLDFWIGVLSSIGLLLVCVAIWFIASNSIGWGETTIDDLGRKVVRALSDKNYEAMKNLTIMGMGDKDLRKLVRIEAEKGNLSENKIDEIVNAEIAQMKGLESGFKESFERMILEGEKIGIDWEMIAFVKVTSRDGGPVKGGSGLPHVIIKCKGRQYRIQLNDSGYIPNVGWRTFGDTISVWEIK